MREIPIIRRDQGRGSIWLGPFKGHAHGFFTTCSLSSATQGGAQPPPELGANRSKESGCARRKARTREPNTMHHSTAKQAGRSQRGGGVSDYNKGQDDARSTCRGWLRRRTILDRSGHGSGSLTRSNFPG